MEEKWTNSGRIEVTFFIGLDGIAYLLEWHPFMEVWWVHQLDESRLVYRSHELIVTEA